MSQRDKILIGAAVTLAALLGGWFFIAKPKRAEMRSLDAQIAAKRSDLDSVSSRAAQYRAARDTLRKNPQVFREAGKALPNRVAMSELLRTLSRTADRTGVEMSDLSTGAGSADSPGISSVDLSLTFDGKFLALQRFLSQLQTLVKVSKQKVNANGRLLALNGVSLTPGATGSLTAKVTATAYILQPGALTIGAAGTGTTGTTATPSAPAAGTGAATPAPATSTPATPSTTGATTP